jgi:hypothetical protein
MEDVVLFLSNDGDSEPIYLWRERPVASAPSPALANTKQTLAANEALDAGLEARLDQHGLGATFSSGTLAVQMGQVMTEVDTFDAGLKALFVQHDLPGTLCADICRALGVEKVGHLADVQQKDLETEKLRPLTEQLKTRHKNVLASLMGSAAAALAELRQENTFASTSTSAPTHGSTATINVEKSRNGGPSARRIYAFFAKHVDDSINVHGEAQRVMQNLQASYWWESLELDCFPQPTFEGFKEAMRNCPARNVFMAYFSGHCSEGGQLCFSRNESGSEMEMRDLEDVAFYIAGASRGVTTRAGGGTIECVLLNACHTYSLAAALRRKGVRYVVCWHQKIKDSIAK